MQLLQYAKDCTSYVNDLKTNNINIGFIPTMGALHEGHISLLRMSAKENPVTVCSIFVNPTQFNDKVDFEKYPRTVEEDLRLLEDAGCHAAFVPVVDEIYPEGSSIGIPEIDFGLLNQVMEAQFRPGHFKGVVQVVNRLFEIVIPDRAYFGEKDYQQLLIIREMVKKLKIPVEISGCPTIREENGLAMSSRNNRLSETDRKAACLLYQAMIEARAKIPGMEVRTLKNWVIGKISSDPRFRVEYFEISDSRTLAPVESWNDGVPCRAFIAAWLGGVRLIDNIMMYP